MGNWKSIASGVLGLAGVLLAGRSTMAETVLYDTAGFASPRFTTTFVNGSDPTVTGTLRGQDAGVIQWHETSNAVGVGPAIGTAVVQTAAVPAGATQAIQVDRTNYDNRWAANGTFNPINGHVNVSWDMNVTHTIANPNNYGPFFGVEGYDSHSGINRLGSFGVDATTGELLVEDPVFGGLNNTPLDATVPFGQWNHYEVSFDFGTQTYLVALNGVIQAAGIPFQTSGTYLTDGDISSLAAAAPGSANDGGTAYFANYVISADTPVAAAPLPGPVWAGLALFGTLAAAKVGTQLTSRRGLAAES